MSNDITKRTDPAAPERQQAEDPASRLKADLMTDALDRVFGKDDKPPVPSGTARVILVHANHGRDPHWDARAQDLQCRMFQAVGGNMQMKFAHYGPDNVEGVRRFRITTAWYSDPDSVAGVMGRTGCDCGCYVYIRSALGQALEESAKKPVQAVVIMVDRHHDDDERLLEAAKFANELRRAGTKVFLIQQGYDPTTTHRLKWLVRIAGAVHFQFDPRTQEREFAEMLETISAFAAGGEEAVKMRGGEAAALLLQHLQQQPMPILKERDHEQVERR